MIYMTTGTLVNNSGIISLSKQNNIITLSTENKYVSTDIELDVRVTKAVLTTSADSNTFEIEVPNGAAGTITFHFAVDAYGNTTVTDTTNS